MIRFKFAHNAAYPFPPQQQPNKDESNSSRKRLQDWSIEELQEELRRRTKSSNQAPTPSTQHHRVAPPVHPPQPNLLHPPPNDPYRNGYGLTPNGVRPRPQAAHPFSPQKHHPQHGPHFPPARSHHPTPYPNYNHPSQQHQVASRCAYQQYPHQPAYYQQHSQGLTGPSAVHTPVSVPTIPPPQQQPARPHYTSPYSGYNQHPAAVNPQQQQFVHPPPCNYPQNWHAYPPSRLSRLALRYSYQPNLPATGYSYQQNPQGRADPRAVPHAAYAPGYLLPPQQHVQVSECVLDAPPEPMPPPPPLVAQPLLEPPSEPMPHPPPLTQPIKDVAQGQAFKKRNNFFCNIACDQFKRFKNYRIFISNKKKEYYSLKTLEEKQAYLASWHSDLGLFRSQRSSVSLCKYCIFRGFDLDKKTKEFVNLSLDKSTSHHKIKEILPILDKFLEDLEQSSWPVAPEKRMISKDSSAFRYQQFCKLLPASQRPGFTFFRRYWKHTHRNLKTWPPARKPTTMQGHGPTDSSMDDLDKALATGRNLSLVTQQANIEEVDPRNEKLIATENAVPDAAQRRSGRIKGDGYIGSPRKHTPSALPKVLLLGMSYPDFQKILEEKGLPAENWMGSSPSSQLPVTIVGRAVAKKVLGQIDGRDLARVIATEKAAKVKAYTVSLEKGATYDAERHFSTNFSLRGFIGELKALPVSYRQVILDYYYSPEGWNSDHWSSYFFQRVLPALVEQKVLDMNDEDDNLPCAVYLPFSPHCFSEVLTAEEVLSPLYAISFLRKADLQEHALWRGTQTVDSELMNKIFGKIRAQENFYCKVTPRDVTERMGYSPRKREIFNRLGAVKEIVFIKLRPVTQKKDGGIEGLMR